MFHQLWMPSGRRRYGVRGGSALAVAVVVATAGLWLLSSVQAAPPRVLPAGQTPADERMKPLKDLDGYFPFLPPRSAAQWDRRAARLRRQMLVSLGLWPMPTKTPLNPVVHGRNELDDYTVEKAYFQSFPGFFVTGSLYRPKTPSGKKCPGVLCPHGHWADGRFHDAGLAGVRKQIVQGGERFEEGGRSPLQSRCVQLARMGCVVFHYDMIGYADSVQIPIELAHRFAKQRAEMNTRENWGLFSPQAEARLQSVMGMQTYNSIRAIDFLASLPDVDPERIAVTGASGGGTQTFILCAVDPRPAVAVPAVMVSTAMQGGCTCENACCLRVGAGNVEFAALFAPKPLLLTAADDWTKEMESKGFPELKRHYEMLAAPDHVMLHSRVDFGHNYNHLSRTAMYGWLNRHFKLGFSEPILERDYRRLTQEEMTVWDEQHPRPEGGADFERALLRWWNEDTERQLADLQPKDKRSLWRFRQMAGGGVDIIIGRRLPDAADLRYERSERTDRGDYLQTTGLLRNKRRGEELPLVLLQPRKSGGPAVVWLHELGKSGLFDEDGQPRPEIRRLVSGGATVAGVDLLYQGEFLVDGKPVQQTRRVANTREAAAYTLGYNHCLFARRVHDVLSVVAFLRGGEDSPREVCLAGLEGAGRWAVAALAQARGAIARTAVDTAEFRFGKLLDIRHPDFLPGGAKYGDLPGMLAVAAPARLWLAGEGQQAPAVVSAAYESAAAVDRLTVFDGPPEEKAAAAVQWLLSRNGQGE